MEEREYRSPDEVYHNGRKVSDILKDREIDLEGADLCNIHLDGFDMTGANLANANLREALISNSELFFADLRFADLHETEFCHVDLRGADLRNCHIMGVQCTGDVRFLGARFSGAFGNRLLVNFAKEKMIIEEMAESDPWTQCELFVWFLLSKCGQSLTRWTLWSILFAVSFAGSFYYTEYFWPGSFHMNSLAITDRWPYFYYSIVTFTTLGFGDITPLTNFASVLVVIEVIFGYVMLGGLISILATKLARRS